MWALPLATASLSVSGWWTAYIYSYDRQGLPCPIFLFFNDLVELSEQHKTGHDRIISLLPQWAINGFSSFMQQRKLWLWIVSFPVYSMPCPCSGSCITSYLSLRAYRRGAGDSLECLINKTRSLSSRDLESSKSFLNVREEVGTGRQMNTESPHSISRAQCGWGKFPGYRMHQAGF